MQNNNWFNMETTVSIGDINYGNHMGNERFLLLFQEVRIRFLERHGLSEQNAGEGCGLIMTEATVKYLAQVFRGEQLLVRVRAAETGKARFTLEYEVLKTADQTLAARGSTTLTAYDYERAKVSRLPRPLMQALGIS